MRTGLIIAPLLLIAMSITAHGRTHALAGLAPLEREEATLQTAVQQEAIEIAAVFTEQMEKSNDIAPLIDRYFINDFDERFAHEAAKTFFHPAKPLALQQAGAADARRYYVALTNFEFSLLRLSLTLEKQMKEKAGKEETEDSDTDELEKMIPPEIMDALNSNPYLAMLVPDDRKEEAGARETDEDKDAVKTIEQLRALALAMENAAARIGKYLNSLPAEQTALKALMPTEDVPQFMSDSAFGVNPQGYLLDNEFYGLPQGTRLICAQAFVMHMDLVSVEGHLKVLAAYIAFND